MFGLTENPVHPGRRTTILRTIESHGSVLRKGDAAFDELRHRCIQQWDLLLRSRRPSVAIAAIHAFDRPGLDGFWQRHGIATASAVLNGGLALGAAHFRDCLPECQCRNKTPAFLPVWTTAAAASGGRLARLSC
jgi:hypothetical protein